MQKYLSSIQLVLENEEIYNIPSKSIQYMKLGKVFDTYITKSNGKCYCDKITQSVFLVVKEIDNITPIHNFSSPFIKRVRDNGDIETIILKFSDNDVVELNVPWNTDNEQWNSWQKVNKTENGNITINIHKNRSKKEKLNYENEN